MDYKCDCAGYYFIYGVLTSYLTAIQGFTPAGIVLRFRYTKKWVNDKPGLPKGWSILNVYDGQVNGLNYPQIQGDLTVLLLG